MKILTWNVARPNLKNSQTIIDIIISYNADIVVLTETNESINLGENYNSISSKLLSNVHDGIDYKEGENRTTIWTKFKILEQKKPFDDFTSLNVLLETNFGNLNLYATIIGIFGGKGERFNQDLESQLAEFQEFNKNNFNLIIGDLNTTFTGFTYPSHEARNLLNDTFQQKNLLNLTQNLDNNVNHIIISKEYLQNKNNTIVTWNLDKKLSDHVGICIEINNQ